MAKEDAGGAAPKAATAMTEQPYKRVVLLCDAACDIRLAVSEAASLAGRWRAALHGVFIEDENLRRFAALPFGQHVSLSCAAITEELTAGDLASLSSARSAGMRRAVAQAAAERGLTWTFGSVRDLPSATSLSTEAGDILVVEATARAFSGAWRPRAAWAKSPAAFSGTVLLRSRGGDATGILVLLPESDGEREKVLSATAALAEDDEDVVIAGDSASLRESEEAIERIFRAGQRTHITKAPAAKDQSALRDLLARHKPALVVVLANDVGTYVAAELLADGRTDLLLVK